MVLLVGCSFSALVAMNYFATARIENVSRSVTQDYMQRVLTNSYLARQLIEFFADLRHLGNGLCYSGSGGVAGRHERAISNVRRNIQDPVMENTMQRTHAILDRYIIGCRQLERSLEDLDRIHRRILGRLSELERLIGDRLIRTTLDGEVTDHFDQLLRLVGSYRESMLMVGGLLEQEKRAHTGIGVEIDDEILALLAKLDLRLLSLNAASADIAAFGAAIHQDLGELGDVVVRARVQATRLREVLDGLDSHRAMLVDALARVDRGVLDQMAGASLEIRELSRSTTIISLAFSIVTLLVTIALLMFIVRGSVERPMAQIMAGIRRLGDGDLDHRIQVQGPREWLAIGRALNRLSEELSASYRILKEQERRFRSLVYNVPVGVYRAVWRRSRFLRTANPRLLSILGAASEQQVAGLSMQDLLVDRGDARRILGELARTGVLEACDCRVRRLDGRIIECRITATLVSGEDGRPAFVDGIVVDVTEEKRMQREAEQSERIESIGRVTGGIAHDFNNLLAIMLGYAQLMLSRAGDNQEHRRYLSRIIGAGERGKTLVQQMLAFKHGGGSDAEPVDLGRAVEGNLDILRDAVTAAVKLELTVEQGLPPVMLNDTELGQLLLNLCLNSRDAMGGRGSLRIDIGYRRGVDEECSDCHRRVLGDWVELAVIDQGTGIPESVRSRMFEPFFTTKDVGEGTGMGLSVVRGVLNRHAAHAVVESSEDRGTTFRILFRPVSGAVADAGSDDTAGPAYVPVGSGQRVMIVDDEPDVLSYLAEALGDGGYHVIAFGSPVDAWQHVADTETAPDLLIVDYMMPTINGVELAERARARFPELPVMLLSGMGGDDMLRGSGLDAAIFLGKPVDLDRLLAEVASLLGIAGDEAVIRKTSV